MDTPRPRQVETRPFPANRRLVTAAMRAGRRIAPMYGLIDVDVTEAKRLLAAHDPPLSVTAFVVASVARAAATHPEVHAYRNWRGKLVTHRHVDVTTLIESATAEGPFGVPYILRDADVRDVPDLTAEIQQAKQGPLTSGDARFDRLASLATRIPGAVRALYAVMARSVAVRQRAGTVSVTAVGMFAHGGGFGLTPPTMMSLEVVVGGITQRPRVVGGQVKVRDVLDLTLVIDHNVVDGAPATRFGAMLRDLIESAAVLAPETATCLPTTSSTTGVAGRGRFP